MKHAEQGDRLLEPEDNARLFKALGHPTRLKLLEYLLQVEHCYCNDLVLRFPYSQSTISQHLRLLRESGLIHSRPVGAKSRFSADRDALSRLTTCLSHLNALNTP